MVGFPPFALTSSSGSYNVLPILTITSTPASFACLITFSSRSRAYASVSFSKTRCVIFHALKSFVRSVWGASRITNSFDFGFNFVIEAERSDWQSSLCKIDSAKRPSSYSSLFCAAYPTGIAIYSVPPSRDRHNEGPSTTQGTNNQASGPGRLSRRANRAGAGQFGANI